LQQQPPTSFHVYSHQESVCLVTLANIWLTLVSTPTGLSVVIPSGPACYIYHCKSNSLSPACQFILFHLSQLSFATSTCMQVSSNEAVDMASTFHKTLYKIQIFNMVEMDLMQRLD